MPPLRTDPPAAAARPTPGAWPDGLRIAVAAWGALLVALMPGAAHAYLDPGVASFVVQGIIGAVAAVGAGVTGYWRKLIRLVRRKPPAGDDTDGEGRQRG
jgi:hypothetical protein